MNAKYKLFDSVRLRETVSVRAHLLSLLDELTEEKLAEVRDFAEFLRGGA